MKLILTLVFASPYAQAGWLKNYCQEIIAHYERRLVQDDPGQYEDASRDWIVRQIDQLQIRERWHRATRHELIHLDLLRRELARRDRFESIVNPKGAHGQAR